MKIWKESTEKELQFHVLNVDICGQGNILVILLGLEKILIRMRSVIKRN